MHMVFLSITTLFTYKNIYIYIWRLLGRGSTDEPLDAYQKRMAQVFDIYSVQGYQKQMAQQKIYIYFFFLGGWGGVEWALLVYRVWGCFWAVDMVAIIKV